MLDRRRDLWLKLRPFQFDHDNHSLTFARRLSREKALVPRSRVTAAAVLTGALAAASTLAVGGLSNDGGGV